MKTQFSRLLACALCIPLISATTHGAVVALESFDYPGGDPLAGKNGGSGFTGGWVQQTGAGVVAHNGLSYGGFPDRGNAATYSVGQADRRTLSTLYNTGEKWVSFLYSHQGGDGTFDVTIASSFGFTDFVRVGQVTAGDNRFGIWSMPGTATGTPNPVYAAAPNAGKGPGVRLVVLKFDFSNNQVSLYLDPAPGTAAPPSPDAVVPWGPGFVGINTILINREGTTSGISVVDEIRVADSFFGVNPRELLVNNGFAYGIDSWKTNPNHGRWNPTQGTPTSGQVNLHPPGSQIRGDVLYQSLNVTDIAGKKVQAQVELGSPGAPDGAAISVYLEYLDNTGTRHRVSLLNPSNASLTGGGLVALGTEYTFPEDAARLVKFGVEKKGDGQFHGDNFHLTGNGLTVNPVPVVHRLTAGCGNLGDTVVIQGNHFGSSPGQVFFGGHVAGNVTLWTDTEVRAQIVDPAMGGAPLLFTADQVENLGMSYFEILSPHYTVTPLNRLVRVVKGQTVEIPLRIEFLNGFNSAGGITFAVVEDPPGDGLFTAFSPTPIKQDGGVILKIDTAGLTAGAHVFTIRSSEGATAARNVPVTVEVVTVNDITFSQYNQGTSSWDPISGPLTVTKQGEISQLQATLIASSGPNLSTYEVPVTISSSNPGRVLHYTDFLGTSRFYSLANGSATLTLIAPDGFSKELVINVNFPASPAITSIGLSPASVDNSGTPNVSFGVMANSALGSAGFMNLQLNEISSGFSNGNQDYTQTFSVIPGTKPGLYEFYATIGSSPETARAVSLLQVVNASGKGEIRGAMRLIDNSFGHNLGGTLEFYDASTGSLLFTHDLNIFAFDSDYIVSYLTPGTYKLRYVPTTFTGLQPQWYPNAGNIADAVPVVVGAGNVVSEVNFFLYSQFTVPLVQAIELCVPDLFSSGSRDLEWQGQKTVHHDGADAARTPVLGDNESSFVEGTIEGPGTLTFWWKASSEANKDKLTFTVNFSNPQQISGETDWTQVSVSLGAGANTVSWSYDKDASGSAGADAAWLDQVLFTPTGAGGPVITSQPQNQTVNQGGTATFSVSATGSGLSYQWKKGTTTLTDGGNISGATSATLTINNAQPADAGSYTVTVSNGGGNTPSDPASLTVRTAPVISSHPQNQAVAQGVNASFSVTATGTAPLSYQWQRNNSPLSDGAGVSGVTTATLNLTGVQPALAGSFRVIVSNAAGNTPSDPASLVVYTPPAITGGPANHTVSSGSQVSFTVAVSGSGPFSYQWKLGGNPIPGAVSESYTIAEASAAHAGTYTVTVTGPGGTITGAAGYLSLADLQMYAGITIVGTTGDQYRVDYTTSLSEPIQWLLLKNVVLTAPSQLVIDENSPGSSKRFYRAVLIIPE